VGALCVWTVVCVGQGNLSEFTTMVKMETRHPVQDYFDCELPAICNHFGVMAARNRKSWKSVYFWCFLKKMTPYREIFKILFPKDSCGPTLINILRSNFVKFG